MVGGVVHQVGSTWEEGCEKCSCTQLKDKTGSLYSAQCTPPVCERTCPQVRCTKCQTWTLCNAFITIGNDYTFQGSTYTQSNRECCGKCTPTSCVESKGEMRGDSLIGAKLRSVCMSRKTMTNLKSICSLGLNYVFSVIK